MITDQSSFFSLYHQDVAQNKFISEHESSKSNFYYQSVYEMLPTFEAEIIVTHRLFNDEENSKPPDCYNNHLAHDGPNT